MSNIEKTPEATNKKLEVVEETMQRLQALKDVAGLEIHQATVIRLKGELTKEGKGQEEIAKIFDEIDQLDKVLKKLEKEIKEKGLKLDDADGFNELFKSLGDKVNPQLGESAKKFYEMFKRVIECLGSLGSDMLDKLGGYINNGALKLVLSGAAVSKEALKRDKVKAGNALGITEAQMKNLDNKYLGDNFWNEVLNDVKTARKEIPNYNLETHIHTLLSKILKNESGDIVPDTVVDRAGARNQSKAIISDRKKEIETATKKATEEAEKKAAAAQKAADAAKPPVKT